MNALTLFLLTHAKKRVTLECSSVKAEILAGNTSNSLYYKQLHENGITSEKR
jgi:hypothetical protein